MPVFIPAQHLHNLARIGFAKNAAHPTPNRAEHSRPQNKYA